MFVLGIIVGIVLLVVLYSLTMLLYIRIRKKYSSTKLVVELVTVLIAIGISIAVKFVILLEASPDTLAGGISRILAAIHSGIAGLAFDGLDAVSDINGALLQCLYTGTSLYSGLIFVSVITTTASYEIYSGVMLFLLRGALRFRNNIDIYVFTSVTEDTLLLANSIAERYAVRRDTSNVRRCRVLFVGEELEAFDRKSALHREIMSRGYIYWSYTNDANHHVSVLSKLHLHIDNDINNPKARAQESRLHIFAFSYNDKLSGLESVNSAMVFDEIGAITREVFLGKACATMVDYYILTDSDINYEYYREETHRVIVGALNQLKVEYDDKDIDKLSQFHNVHIVNEAVMAGKCLSTQRTAMFQQDFAKGGTLLLQDNMPNADNMYKAIVLGFGKTGQQAMNALFVDTAYVDNQGVPSQFVADVYDSNIDTIAGLFASTHRMYLCANRGSDVHPIDIAHPSVVSQYDKFKWHYTSEVIQSMSQDSSLQNIDDVIRYMAFPLVTFHKTSCFDYSFLEFLDGNTGVEACQCNKSMCNAFIVALGKDEYNIEMGNSLIDDFKHDFAKMRNNAPQYLYINIRDEKNYSRVNWTENDKKLYPYLKVVLFGNRQYMYSYDNIVEDSDDMKYHYGYNLVSNSAEGTQSIMSQLQQALLSQDDTDYMSLLKSIHDKVVNDKSWQHRQEWVSVPMFQRQSNSLARVFGEYYRQYSHNKTRLSASDLRYCAELEHNRWNRFHMANGWLFSATKNKPVKLHNNICPFDMLDIATKTYDLVNLALAYEQNNKENNDEG